MPLSLRLQPPNTLPDGQTVIAMAGDSLTIGRGEENDLVLVDPERTLSNRHCIVEHRSGDYVITDISTNGTFLNYSAERLDHLPTPLNNGDVIIVGDFELVVEITTGAAADGPDQNTSAPLPPLDAGPITPAKPDRSFCERKRDAAARCFVRHRAGFSGRSSGSTGAGDDATDTIAG